MKIEATADLIMPEDHLAQAMVSPRHAAKFRREPGHFQAHADQRV